MIRNFNKHKAAISSLSLLPISLPATPPDPTGTISINGTQADQNVDVEMDKVEGGEEDAVGSPDSYGSLFADEDEDNEGGVKKDPSPNINTNPAPVPPPQAPPPPSRAPVLPPSNRPGLLSNPRAPPRVGLPSLTPATYKEFSDDIMLVASLDGEVALHDRRIGSSLVGKLESGPKTPPWCMSVSRICTWGFCNQLTPVQLSTWDE